MNNKLSQEKLDFFIRYALQEDVGSGDYTSQATISPDDTSKARLLVKDKGIIAGIEFAKAVFSHLDSDMEMDIILEDGEQVKQGDVAFTIEGNTRSILKGERLVLNTMQRLSGISTLSAQYHNEVRGTGVTILDTRKTTPLMRFLEKWAVALGGCENYRDGLYDWIMIKDNHIDASGGIAEAIQSVKSFLKDRDLSLDMTVEVRNLDELQLVLNEGGVRRIMLDNFDLTTTHAAVEIIGDKAEVEASGGININTVRPVAETGVDYISVGALTHSAPTLDLSLKIMKEEE